MAPFLVLLLSIVYAAVFALAQGGSHFNNPPEISSATPNPSTNSVYKVGDVLNIAWSTTYNVVTLVINQEKSSLTQIDYLPNSIALTQQSYSWKVTVDGSDRGSTFDLALDNKFNFMLFRVNETAPFSTSTFFNITNATVNQYGNIISTSATLSATTLPSSALTSDTGTTAVLPSITSASSTSALIQTGLSATTKVGLGVGLGVGGLVLIAGFMGCLFLRQKGSGEQTNNDPTPQYDDAQQKLAHENWWPPSELHAAAPPAPHPTELPS